MLLQEQLTLENLLSTLDQQEKGIISGFKQRCVSETKIIKNKIADGLDENEWSLTDIEKILLLKLLQKIYKKSIFPFNNI